MPARWRTYYVVVLLLAVLGALSASAGDYVIVVDTSASMKDPISGADRRNRLTTVQEELVKYLKALPLGSRVYLIAFNSGIVSEKELVLKTGAELQVALDWTADLRKIRAGDTYLWAAVRTALRIATQYANQSTDQPVSVLVLTDGQDNDPNAPSLERILAEFPLKIQKNEIQAGLVLLGNIDLRSVGKAKELGIDVVINADWTHIFPPVIKWEPNPPKVGQEVSFFDTSRFGYESYEWSIDGKSVGSERKLAHTFAKDGSHRVTLDVSDAKGRSTRSTATVLVSKTDLTCDVVISASEVEPGQQVGFFSRVTGDPDKYSWKVNGREVATKAEHTLAFNTAGNYEIRLEIQSGTTKAVSGKRVIQVRDPKVQMAFKCPTEVTSGQAVQFINESIGRLESFRWTFGDGETSARRNPSHTYKNDGTDPKEFRVRLQGRTITGKTFESAPVTVRVLPIVSIKPPHAAFRVVGDAPYKVGLRIQVIDTSSGLIDSYFWSLEGEGTSAEPSPEFTPTSVGEKTLRQIVAGPGGSSTNEQKIVIVQRFVPPAITRIKASPHKPRLQEDGSVTVIFQAAITGEYETVKWSFGDGTKSGRLRPSHTYNNAGMYTVHVSARNAGDQEGSASIQIQVLPPPPWWYQIPVYVVGAVVVWVLIIVPFILKPFISPHKTVALRSTTSYSLRQIAQRGHLRWLWPRSAVRIGTQQSDDIRLVTADGTRKTLAIIKRAFASNDYRVLPQQEHSVKLLEKYLVSIPLGEGRVLRDGDQICIGDETFSWVSPSKKT